MVAMWGEAGSFSSANTLWVADEYISGRWQTKVGVTVYFFAHYNPDGEYSVGVERMPSTLLQQIFSVVWNIITFPLWLPNYIINFLLGLFN